MNKLYSGSFALGTATYLLVHNSAPVLAGILIAFGGQHWIKSVVKNEENEQ